MADKEIFSLDENFNVNLDNENRNFNLSATQDDEDFEVEFGEVTNLGTTDYNKLQNKPQINGVTLEENKTSSDLGLQPSGDYASSSEIPTKTSDIENDSGFITNEVNNLVNYYTKTQVDNLNGNGVSY